IGDVIQPEKDYKTGLKRGALYKVMETGPGNFLTVKSEQGDLITFSPMKNFKLSVYMPEKCEFSVGDKVRITRNDASLDLANGDRCQVVKAQDDQLVLTNGIRQIHLDKNKSLHVQHAYATTVHSSQGLTCDRVLIDLNTQSPTTSKETYYVAISRARLEA